MPIISQSVRVSFEDELVPLMSRIDDFEVVADPESRHAAYLFSDAGSPGYMLRKSGPTGAPFVRSSLHSTEHGSELGDRRDRPCVTLALQPICHSGGHGHDPVLGADTYCCIYDLLIAATVPDGSGGTRFVPLDDPEIRALADELWVSERLRKTSCHLSDGCCVHTRVRDVYRNEQKYAGVDSSFFVQLWQSPLTPTDPGLLDIRMMLTE